MDILYIISHLGAGGSQKVIVSLANSAADNGYKVGLLVLNTDIEKMYVIHDSVELVKLGKEHHNHIKGKYDALLSWINTCKEIRKVIKARNPRVIISFICPTNIKVLLAKLYLKNAKLIISERNNVDLQRFSAPIRIARRLLYRFADAVTANSESSVSSMRAYVNKDKLYYLPNPLDFPENIAPASSINNKNHVDIFFAGRLVPQKNILMVVEALSVLIHKNCHFKLTIAGDGPLKEDIVNFVHLNNILDHVNMLGYVNNVENYLSQSDIFVLCSEYEGVSNSLLEAMAHGLVCVVSAEANSSSGLIRNNQNGIVLEINDAEHLCEALYSIYSDRKKMRALGAKARESIKPFEFSNVTQKWESLYKKILSI